MREYFYFVLQTCTQGQQETTAGIKCLVSGKRHSTACRSKSAENVSEKHENEPQFFPKQITIPLKVHRDTFHSLAVRRNRIGKQNQGHLMH